MERGAEGESGRRWRRGWKREMGGEAEKEGERRSEREAVIAIANRERDKIVIDSK